MNIISLYLFMCRLSFVNLADYWITSGCLGWMFHYQDRHELVWTIALTQLTTIQNERAQTQSQESKNVWKSFLKMKKKNWLILSWQKNLHFFHTFQREKPESFFSFAWKLFCPGNYNSLTCFPRWSWNAILYLNWLSFSNWRHGAQAKWLELKAIRSRDYIRNRFKWWNWNGWWC